MKETKLSHHIIRKVSNHFRDFHIVWILLAIVLFTPLLYMFNIISWRIASWLVYPAIAFFFIYLIWKPLGAVYGLMGTTGSIQLYFVNFLLITFLFSVVYYWGFFKDAGISYDINQPHVDFAYYQNHNTDERPMVLCDTTISYHLQFESKKDTIISITKSTIHYQPISWEYVWRNTILTTLTQEPTELFTAAATYNYGMTEVETDDDKDLPSQNIKRTTMLNWILNLQVLISWIFFGVFISLLYSKFRYES